MKAIEQALHPPKSQTVFWFLAILLLAAGLRLYRLDLIDYRYDEASSVQYALDIINGRLIAVAPFSGSLASHPPLFLYVLAIPMIFTRDLMSVVTFRVLLDVAAIAVLGLLCLRFANKRVALLAMLLFAIAPAAILSARRMSIELLPIFTLILLYGLFDVWIRRNPAAWTWIGFGLALCIGNHLTSIFFLPILIITVVFRRKTLRLRPLALGLLPLVLLLAVYLASDATNGFVNVKGVLSSTSEVVVTNLDALNMALWSSGGAHISDLTGRAIQQWNDQVPQWLKWLNSLDDLQQLAVIVCAIIPMTQLLRHLVSRRRRLTNPTGAPGATGAASATAATASDDYLFAAVTVLFWVLPILAQLRHSRPIVTHYLTILYPTPFLLMAIGIDAALTSAKRFSAHFGLRQTTLYRGIATALALTIAVIGVWQVYSIMALTSFVERNDTTGGYGLPLRSALIAANQAKQAAAQGVSNQVVVVIEDYLTPWHEQGIILNTLLADIPHRFINSKVDGWIFRPEGTSYIFAPGTESMLTRMLAYFDADETQISSAPIRSSGSAGYTYVRIKSLPQLAGFKQARPATWESGIDLVSFRMSMTTTVVTMETIMQVTQAQPDGVNYHWYNHIFDGSTKLVGLDASGVHPSSWRPGDYLLQRFRIPLQAALPDNPLYIRYGSYHFPEAQSVMVSEDGKQPENGVNLPMPYPLR